MKYVIELGTSSSNVIVNGVLYNFGKEKAETNEQEPNEQLYDYTIDTSGVSVLWTAYKFTNKVGVSGRFEDFKISVEKEAQTIEALLETSEIEIYTTSVNSNSEIRDPKLRASFWVFHTDTILGVIRDIDNGKGRLDLKMNAIIKPLDYTYIIKNDTIFLSTTIDLKLWKGGAAIQSINKECYELHTGADGISKLWPDVDVTIKMPLEKILLSN